MSALRPCRLLVVTAIAVTLAACGATPDPAGIEDAADTPASAPDEDASMPHDDESMPHDDESMPHDDESMPHDDESAAADRVVAIEMVDVAFSVEELEVAVGETIRFDFTNAGEAVHEALIGDLHLQEEHEEDMASGHGEMDHHGMLPSVTLDPGESGSLVHTFDEAGEFWIGCHVPGHWPAGMRTRVVVG